MRNIFQEIITYLFLKHLVASSSILLETFWFDCWSIYAGVYYIWLILWLLGEKKSLPNVSANIFSAALCGLFSNSVSSKVYLLYSLFWCVYSSDGYDNNWLLGISIALHALPCLDYTRAATIKVSHQQHQHKSVTLDNHFTSFYVT